LRPPTKCRMICLLLNNDGTENIHEHIDLIYLPGSERCCCRPAELPGRAHLAESPHRVCPDCLGLRACGHPRHFPVMNYYRQTQNTTCMPARLNDMQICQSLRAALDLRFCLRTGQFQFRSPDQTKMTCISGDELLMLISTTLAQQPEHFAPGSIRPRRVKRLVNVLRGQCADASGDAILVLRRFVASALELQPGSDVTGAEIREAFVRAIADPVLSDYEFHRLLPVIVRNVFCVPKCHDIRRPGVLGKPTHRNGWTGLKLRFAARKTDAADAADTSSQTSTDNNFQTKDQIL